MLEILEHLPYAGFFAVCRFFFSNFQVFEKFFLEYHGRVSISLDTDQI